MKSYIKQIKKYILFEILFDIICTLLLAFTPIVQKWLFDIGIYSGLSGIVKAVMMYVIIQILYVISTYLCLLVTWKGAIKFELLLKRSFLQSVFSMKNREFYKKPIGEYISLQGNDITALEQDYLQPWVDIIRSVNMLLIYGIITFVLVDWRIALALLMCSLVTIIGPKLTGKTVSGKRNKYQIQMAAYVSKITDLLEGFKLINSATIQNINGVHEDVLQETAKKRYAYGKSKSMSLSINELAVKTIQIVSFAVVGILLINDEITIGTGIATFGYVSSFLQPINSILYDVNAIQSVKEVKDKFLSYTYGQLEQKSKKPMELQSRVSFENVSYEYDHFSVKNISFDFERGKKYAIIGHNGSGKSTLLKMIMGYLEPTSGLISIDDMALPELDTSELISYTDQNEHVFRDDYIENATVYRSYSTERLFHTINQFGIKIFDTIKTKKSNDNCQELSGGEKQALSLLRMITRDTPVILMDEPFSAVDVHSKEYMEKYLFNQAEMKNKLLIFVTHDLGDKLNQFDEVLLLKNGTIIANDKFERLKLTNEYKAFCEQEA